MRIILVVFLFLILNSCNEKKNVDEKRRDEIELSVINNSDFKIENVQIEIKENEKKYK